MREENVMLNRELATLLYAVLLEGQVGVEN